MNRDSVVILKQSKELSLKKIALISVMLVCGNIISKYILLVALAYIVYLFCAQDDTENYYLGLFLISNIRVFDTFGITFVVNAILSIPLIVYLVRRKRKFNRYIVFGWFFLLLWEVLHILVYENYSNSPNELSTFLGMLFCITLTLNEKERLDFNKAWLFFTLGILFSGLAYIIVNPSYLNNIVSKITMGYRFRGYAGEPNYYALYICLSLSGLFIFTKYTIWHYLSMCALILIGIMTASKMCILLMTFIIVVGFTSCIREKKYKSKKEFVFYGVILLLLIGFLFKKTIIVFANNFLKRAGLLGGNLDVEKVTSGRSSIISDYVHILFNDIGSLLFGKGMQYHLFYSEAKGYGAHNTYLDAILAWGGIGTIVLVSVIIIWVKDFSIESHENVGLRKTNILIMVLLINFLDLSCLSATMFWWIISFSILSIQSYKKQTIKMSPKQDITY